MLSVQKTILLIDDDPEELELFEVAIEEFGLPIRLLYAGECNIERLRALPQPDLIFLDINMPEFDGFHWLKGIRERLATEIPIIMYSTTLNPQRVAMAYNLGANLFLSKPSSFNTLAAALQHILEIDWNNPRQVAVERYQQETFHLVY
ncbi:response regulator [Flavisolibacter tropicus]|uniref:response regulator n=1 Tax=Flavisolibacter tropicus TaxID=1492898 RepID=UPI00083799C2|nr:response regulator [Flavisolibacter tropicus]